MDNFDLRKYLAEGKLYENAVVSMDMQDVLKGERFRGNDFHNKSNSLEDYKKNMKVIPFNGMHEKNRNNYIYTVTGIEDGMVKSTDSKGIDKLHHPEDLIIITGYATS